MREATMRARSVLALIALSALLILSSCGGGGSRDLLVGAVVARADLGNVSVVVGLFEGSTSGPGVTGASVTVNGTPIDEVDAEFSPGLYMILIGGPNVTAGTDALLEIERGTTLVSATLTMPEKPVITAPTDGEAVGGPVNAIWTSTTDPDSFEVFVDDAYTSFVGDYSVSLTGAARGLLMTGIFDTASEDSDFTVIAVNSTTSFTGVVAPDSTFAVSNQTDRSFNPN